MVQGCKSWLVFPKYTSETLKALLSSASRKGFVLALPAGPKFLFSEAITPNVNNSSLYQIKDMIVKANDHLLIEPLIIPRQCAQWFAWVIFFNPHNSSTR